MSLYGMMRTGVSGMNAQSNRLGTVADNIANSDSSGYKRASTEFSSMLMENAAGSYNSGGVETSVRYAISEAGSYTFTTSDTDLAIKGTGFFCVEGPDGSRFLTRAGSFVPDKDGYLVNAAGYKLLQAPPGTDPKNVKDLATLVLVEVPTEGLPPVASSTGNLAVNLPSSAAVNDQQKTSLVAYDSGGGQHLLNFTYEKANTNQWTLTVENQTSGVQIGQITLNFDAGGNLISTVPASTPPTLSTIPDALDGSVLGSIQIDLSNTSQFNKDFGVAGTPQIDGSAASGISGYTVSSNGTVAAVYKNGETSEVGKLALATLINPNSLEPHAGDVFSTSIESGELQFGAAESDSFGSIMSGAVEGSNVDIGTELTEMISAQRTYTANSKVFQTGAELLDVLVNLKR